jgi:hypothetical protein
MGLTAAIMWVNAQKDAKVALVMILKSAYHVWIMPNGPYSGLASANLTGVGSSATPMTVLATPTAA